MKFKEFYKEQNNNDDTSPDDEKKKKKKKPRPTPRIEGPAYTVLPGERRRGIGAIYTDTVQTGTVIETIQVGKKYKRLDQYNEPTGTVKVEKQLEKGGVGIWWVKDLKTNKHHRVRGDQLVEQEEREEKEKTPAERALEVEKEREKRDKEDQKRRKETIEARIQALVDQRKGIDDRAEELKKRQQDIGD